MPALVDYIERARKLERNYADKQLRLERQFKQAMNEHKVTCLCERTVTVHTAFRCYYCGEYFCAACAEVHFD